MLFLPPQLSFDCLPFGFLLLGNLSETDKQALPRGKLNSGNVTAQPQMQEDSADFWPLSYLLKSKALKTVPPVCSWQPCAVQGVLRLSGSLALPSAGLRPPHPGQARGYLLLPWFLSALQLELWWLRSLWFWGAVQV